MMTSATIDSYQSLKPSLALIVPELILAAGAMALLMLGVYRGDRSARLVSWLAIAVIVLAGLFVLDGPAERALAFGGALVVDSYAQFFKSLMLIGAAVSILLSLDFIRREKFERFEYPVLILLATLGMSVMISANGLIALYMGIELQSLSLYVLAAFKRDSLRASEAGLKYFVLGALSSGLLLYGCSLIYGFTGTVNFDVLRQLVTPGSLSLGLIFGLVFLIAGLAFKVSAVPFHMWTPDVYQGAPTPVTTLFASAPKIAAMAVFIRVLVWPFADGGAGLVPEWRQILIALALLSVVLGAFAAIGQSNIKRLMAYSSIGHMGFALIGLAAGTEEGVRGVLIYLTIYLPMTLGVFACILTMRRRTGMVEDINDLAGLARTQPMMAAALLLLLFSLAGIPPLAGFFAKFYVLIAAVNAGLYSLAIIALLASVVGAYYYLRIVKIMYFDAPAESFVGPVGGEVAGVIGLSSLFILFYVLFAFPLLGASGLAAGALFP